VLLHLFFFWVAFPLPKTTPNPGFPLFVIFCTVFFFLATNNPKKKPLGPPIYVTNRWCRGPPLVTAPLLGFVHPPNTPFNTSSIPPPVSGGSPKETSLTFWGTVLFVLPPVPLLLFFFSSLPCGVLSKPLGSPNPVCFTPSLCYLPSGPCPTPQQTPPNPWFCSFGFCVRWVGQKNPMVCLVPPPPPPFFFAFPVTLVFFSLTTFLFFFFFCPHFSFLPTFQKPVVSNLFPPRPKLFVVYVWWEPLVGGRGGFTLVPTIVLVHLPSVF